MVVLYGVRCSKGCLDESQHLLQIDQGCMRTARAHVGSWQNRKHWLVKTSEVWCSMVQSSCIEAIELSLVALNQEALAKPRDLKP